MNKSNLPQKIIVSVLTVLVCCGIYACGVYVGSLGFGSGITADVMLTVFCVYYSLSVCALMRRKPFRVPRTPIKKLFRICFASAAVIYLFLAASIFFIGTSYSMIGSVQTVYLIFCVYSLCRMTYAASIRLEPSSDTATLDENRYQELYSAAKKAADAIGLSTGDLQINVTGGIVVSAIEIDGDIRLLVGAQLPSLVSEYELEALFTAELGLIRAGSVSFDSQIKKKFTHWNLAVSDEPGRFPNFLMAIQFRLLESRLSSELEAALILDESIREQAVICFGIPSDYVNAIAKITLFSLYFRSPRRIHYYDTPEPPRDIEEQLSADYRRFRDENAVRLDHVIRNTTSVGNSTPFSELLDHLSPDGKYDLFTEPISNAYICEAEDLLITASGDFADSVADEYTEQRAKDYLPAIESITEYEEQLSNGKTPGTFDALRAAEAYMVVGCPEKAEAVYGQILSESPSNGRACLEKGLLLIGSYDETAIQYFDRAIDDNRFCAGKVYTALAAYYGIIGDDRNASLYREKAEAFESADSTAKSRIFDISSAADLAPVRLDPDTLNEISGNLHKTVRNCAKKILMAGRELDGQYYILVFIRLKSELSDDARSSVISDVYLYLDSREEIFYLTDYDECPTVYEIADRSEKSVKIDTD